MNKKKLLKKLQHFFDRQQAEKEVEREKLKSILRKLKKKERKLLAKIEHETDDTLIKKYQIELEIINKQLKKGKTILHESHGA